MHTETNLVTAWKFMSLLLWGLLIMSATNASEQLLTDFTDTSADLGWTVVNDNVMGGRSDGDFRVNEGRLRFRGRTNTNGGGFSSIRSQRLELDLSEYDGIRLRVNGDGRRYIWRLTTDAKTRGRDVSYWAGFDTQDGEWTAVDVPFERFRPRFRGTWLSGPELDLGTITSVGLMIYDGHDGDFVIELDRIAAYRARDAFSLADYVWKRRVLVVNAASEEDPRFREQRAAIEASRDAFAERDLVLVALLGTGESIAAERPLIPDEASAVREKLSLSADTFSVVLLGKDGTVKLSNDRVTAMQEIYAVIDRMPMRQREMREP